MLRWTGKWEWRARFRSGSESERANYWRGLERATFFASFHWTILLPCYIFYFLLKNPFPYHSSTGSYAPVCRLAACTMHILLIKRQWYDWVLLKVALKHSSPWSASSIPFIDSIITRGYLYWSQVFPFHLILVWTPKEDLVSLIRGTTPSRSASCQVSGTNHTHLALRMDPNEYLVHGNVTFLVSKILLLPDFYEQHL